MRKLLLVLLILPSIMYAESYWQQNVHYTIEASLDPAEHTIDGREEIVYINNSPDRLNTVIFRLYWNAFRPGSHARQFMQQNKQYYQFDTSGGMNVKQIAILEGGREIFPVFTIDNTLMEVLLPSPLLPGDTIRFGVGFVGSIPGEVTRAGHEGRDYSIAQWYPQIATYDRYGWDRSQYLLAFEFHNEFATFDVSVTLPRSFTLGYSGNLLNPEEVYPESVRTRLQEASEMPGTVRIADYSEAEWTTGDSDLVTWKFHSDCANDFAWSANEHYIWDVAHWSSPSSDRTVAVHALYFDDVAGYWKDAPQFGAHALGLFSTRFGMFPYENMFLVESGEGGGMEYPGLTFIGHYGDEYTHDLYGVIAHEIAHNWSPMMMGTNETMFPFMDEGFATFMTGVAMEAYYGRYHNAATFSAWYHRLLRFPEDDVRNQMQLSYLTTATTGHEEPLSTPGYRFTEAHSPGQAYSKMGSVLLMLQYVLGDSVFDEVMREYNHRWKFKHPYPDDFIAVAQEVSGRRDLRWFFNQWIDRTYTCDYGIGGLEYETVKDHSRTAFRTRLRLHRIGEAIMPLDVHVSLEDGGETVVDIPVERWMNAETCVDTFVVLPSPPQRAEINPDGRIADINRLNNVTGLPPVDLGFDNTFYEATPQDAYALKWRPSIWYTDEGGWNAGYRLRGSYLEDMYGVRFYHLFNFRDRTMNYDLSLTHNAWKVSPLTTLTARVWRMEGRKGVSVGFSKGFRRALSIPPYHTVSVRYGYVQADNPEYLLLPDTWQQGGLHRMTAGYNYTNRGSYWRTSAAVTFEASTSLFSESDFLYTKRSIEVKADFDMPGRWIMALRYFNGIGSGDIPGQTRYYFANASPLEQLDSPLLRSKGVIPTTLRDHAIAPGGGLMRGYVDQFRTGDKMEAINAEARFGSLIPFFRPRIPVLSSLMDQLKTTFFLDAGRIVRQDETLWKARFEIDCGFGVQLNSLRRLFGVLGQSDLFTDIGLETIRFDVPLYVSAPLPDEAKLKFRWVLTMTRAF
jgi:aminopeptidase N